MWERHRAPRCRGVHIGSNAAGPPESSPSPERWRRSGAPSHDPRVRSRRRRPLAGGDRNGAAPGLEPGAVLDGARPGDSHRPRRRPAGARAGGQRLGARVQPRLASDRGRREAQRCGRLHQRWQRLARHVEGARDRHHQRGGHGLGRRRRRRRVGLRGDHTRLLGHLPDAVRPERRTARARLDRRSDVPRHAGALPGRHGPDHPARPRATCSATSPSP